MIHKHCLLYKKSHVAAHFTDEVRFDKVGDGFGSVSNASIEPGVRFATTPYLKYALNAECTMYIHAKSFDAFHGL